jgi:molybdopterin converting factor subunit 1
MSQVEVLVFARIREAAGATKVTLQIEEPVRVATLRAALERRFPEHSSLIRGCLFAIDGDYAAPESVIPEGAEVACIPPVSGG